MKFISCDQCGESYDHTLRLRYRLSEVGSVGSSPEYDFCAQECLLDWALARLRAERDNWRENFHEEQARPGKKR